MRVIIAGSRWFRDYELLKEKCDKILQNVKDVEIVCGMCAGADLLGKEYAEACGYNIREFHPEWHVHGRQAGVLRNIQMAENADALIAFNSGGRGTTNMIQEAKKRGLKIREIRIKTLWEHGEDGYIDKQGILKKSSPKT